MAEVQVAFFTLKKKAQRRYFHSLWLDSTQEVPNFEVSFLHGRAFRLCVCGGGSSASAGDGSGFHRSRMGMASRPCGSAHERADEQP